MRHTRREENAGETATAMQRARGDATAIDYLADRLHLASFRAYLHATVRSMSGLAPVLLNAHGFGVADALKSVRPVRNWLSGCSSDLPLNGRRYLNGGAGCDPISPLDLWKTEPFDFRGNAFISEGALGDWLMIGILGTALELDFRSSLFHLVTRAGTANLMFDGALPETLALSCANQALDRVVDLPLLHGRGFVVDHILKNTDQTILIFKAGELVLHTPWDADGRLPQTA